MDRITRRFEGRRSTSSCINLWSKYTSFEVQLGFLIGDWAEWVSLPQLACHQMTLDYASRIFKSPVDSYLRTAFLLSERSFLPSKDLVASSRQAYQRLKYRHVEQVAITLPKCSLVKLH